MTDSSGSNHMQKEPRDVFHRVPTTIPVGSILNNEHPCSYLPGRTANLPLILPANILSLNAMDAALAAGMRRAGLFLYYTQCLGCNACEPTRFDVQQFRWTESWKRILKRGDRQLQFKPEHSSDIMHCSLVSQPTPFAFLGTHFPWLMSG